MTTLNSPTPLAIVRSITRNQLQMLLLAILSAGAHVVSWLVPGCWWGTWVGLLGMSLIAVMNPPRQAFRLGILIGLLAILGIFHWAPRALELSMSAPWWLAYSLFALLAVWESLLLGIYCGLVSFATHSGGKGSNLNGLYLAPFIWVTVEYGWPKIFPWMIGNSQLELLPLLQIANITGSGGVGFGMVFFTAIPAAWYLASQYRDDRASGRVYEQEFTRQAKFAVWQGFTLFTALATGWMAVVWTYGLLSIRDWETNEYQLKHLRAAVVQVNNSKAGSEQRLLDETFALDEKVELICWPESSLGTYCTDLQSFADRDKTVQLSRESFQSLRPTEKCRADILAGGRTYAATSPTVGPYRMTAFLIDPQETIRCTYHKRTLLPFGEYMPGQYHFPALREWATLKDITEPGESAHCLLSSSGVKIGTVICYEDILPANARSLVRNGAEVLVSIVNDYRFENPLTLQQHQWTALMRAVENRRYLLRSSTTGVTCIISPTGKVLSQLPVLTEGSLVHDVALVQSQTLYTRFGDWFPYTCTVITLLGIVFVYRQK